MIGLMFEFFVDEGELLFNEKVMSLDPTNHPKM